MVSLKLAVELPLVKLPLAVELPLAVDLPLAVEFELDA